MVCLCEEGVGERASKGGVRVWLYSIWMCGCGRAEEVRWRTSAPRRARLGILGITVSSLLFRYCYPAVRSAHRRVRAQGEVLRLWVEARELKGLGLAILDAMYVAVIV